MPDVGSIIRSKKYKPVTNIEEYEKGKAVLKVVLSFNIRPFIFLTSKSCFMSIDHLPVSLRWNKKKKKGIILKASTSHNSSG
jgi:hypothetical protein